MKDKSLKDRTHYELQWFNNDDNEWVDMVVYDTKKKAKQEKEFLEKEERKQEHGRTRYTYRIVRCITKKEVVK